MRKGKVKVTRIDDKTSRQVCFSKRRSGLIKKAEELSVLCDVDVAVFVVSNTNKLYEFPDAARLNKILERYTALVDVKKAKTEAKVTEDCSENTTIWKCNNALEAVQRYMEGGNVNQMNINDIVQLEQILDSSLKLALKRKTHLMTDAYSGSNTAVEDMVSAAGGAEVEDEDGTNKKKKHDENSSNRQGCSLLREAMLSLA